MVRTFPRIYNENCICVVFNIENQQARYRDIGILRSESNPTYINTNIDTTPHSSLLTDIHLYELQRKMTSTIPGGGFILSLPSPAPSTLSTTSASTATPSPLPRQRNHPLIAGSMKETGVINHLDRCLLGVNRRHAKKFSRVYEGQGGGEGEEQERGYENFKEIGRDIEGLIDVVWVSGTRMSPSLSPSKVRNDS